MIFSEVSAINTPSGSVANGAMITITWSYTPQANALPGTLSVIDNTTKNTVIISSSITLSTQSYQWTVNVPPGTYYLALNDGSGDKYSGTFTVFQAGGAAPAASGAAPAASAASGGAAPAPAPAASGAPAGGAPAASGAAPSAAAPASPAQPSPAAQQPSSQPASPAQPSPKAPSASSGASNASPSSSGKSTSSPTTAPTSDAAISFTGSSIKLLFSLIVVAAAMVHFA
ncbi:2764_t:CDS:2 [Gigaspora margarita]|uniref:2764_t:CDS:1 n=1 Tax=Gigaspora margarita TaxID=4874 RepID=A0ABN7VDS3_GIGMA|nr:2764_t:CDS:2 [Gigaspora margarita]